MKGTSKIVLNEQLIDKLKKDGVVRCALVEQVMKSIDRIDFNKSAFYNDSPDYLGYNATISAPHMHAHALEILQNSLQNAKKSLDVGSGSGYLTLAMAKLMEKNKGISYGIEHVPQLVQESIQNIKKNHQQYLDEHRVVVEQGDGRQGLDKYQPFDCIHVGAATPIVPQKLLDQLAPGGRMVVPIGEQGFQYFTIFDKDLQGNISTKQTFGVTYVPLTDLQKQISS